MDRPNAAYILTVIAEGLYKKLKESEGAKAVPPE